MPKYKVELSDGRKFVVEADGQPSESDILASLGDSLDGKAPTPSTEQRGGLTRPFTSLVKPSERAAVVGGILGHEVPTAPDQSPSLSDIASEFKKAPGSSTASTAFGLTGIPSIIEFIKTAIKTVPDIAASSGVLPGVPGNPGAVARGAVGGLAQGVMEQATPANIATLLLPKLRAGIKAAKAEPVIDRYMPNKSGYEPQPAKPVPGKVFVEEAPVIERYGPNTGGMEPTPTPASTPRVPYAQPTEFTGPKEAPFEPGNTQKLPPKQKPVDTRPPVKEVPQEPAKVIEQAHAEADVQLGQGNVEQAANTIEQKAKLTVAELARKMRDQYGSQRAGDMLYGKSMKRAARKEAIKNLAPGESKMPEIVKDAIQKTGGLAKSDNPGYASTLQKFSSEAGGIDPKLLMGAGGAAVGGAIGATQGETPEDRTTNALLGAGLGAITVPLIAHAAAQGAPQTLQKYIYTSVLSSPQSVIKAYLGGVGGAIAAATEKLAGGDAAGGARILNSLFSRKHVPRMIQAFKHPEITGRVGDSPTLVGRIFEGVNEPAIRAMQEGGVGRDDAIRYTLSGTPTTPLGKDILGLWSRYFTLRLATSLFPRVGVQVLERGLERSPAGLMKLKGINEGASTGTRVARAGMGTAAGAAAYAASDQLPDWAKPYAVALSGVYGLPVGLGLAVGTARASGKSGAGQVMAGTQEVARNMPFPQYGPADALNPTGALSAMLVPNIVRDVARASDPYERSTTGVPFGRAMAKVPGLRQKLPVKGRNVNIAGEPNEDRSSPVERFFNPASKEQKRFKDVPDNVAGELKRLDVRINAPALDGYKNDKVLGRLSIPPDVLERSRAERRQFLLPQIEKAMSSPVYARSDDEKKKRILEAVISRAESAGNQKARANVIKTLRDSGALKK